MVLESEGGTPVTLADVAKVIQAYTPRTGGGRVQQAESATSSRASCCCGAGAPDTVLTALHAKIDELNAKVLPPRA